jgi:putative DNA primase/helicase
MAQANHSILSNWLKRAARIDRRLSRYPDGSLRPYVAPNRSDLAGKPVRLQYCWAAAAGLLPRADRAGRAGGERSEKFQEVVWHLAAKGLTIEQIVDELSKHPNGIGVKYANRLLAEVTRSFGKWQAQRRANARGAAPSAVSVPWPQIKVVPSELPRVINEAEDALLLLGREIYQRGGLLVRPVLNVIKASGDREIEGWQLVELTRPWLVNQLCCAAQFQQFDKRSKNFVPVDAPDKVADCYLNRRGNWKVPQIAGIANAPFLHADGTIHDWEGYDPVSGLLCRWDGQVFPSVARAPSKADAEAALTELKKPLAEFPFVTKGDRAAALSAMLTCIDRRGMNFVPLHAFTAPTPGTGKGLLINVIAVTATGRNAAPFDQSRNEEEFKKTLGSALIAGHSLIAIDNCVHILESSLLNIAVTEPVFGVRVLGVSQNRDTRRSSSMATT